MVRHHSSEMETALHSFCGACVRQHAAARAIEARRGGTPSLAESVKLPAARAASEFRRFERIAPLYRMGALSSVNAESLTRSIFTWRFPGVTQNALITAVVGGKLVSPVFSALGLDWQLWFYPNGESAVRSPGQPHLVLRLLSPDVAPFKPSVASASLGDVTVAYGDVTFSTQTPRPASAVPQAALSWPYSNPMRNYAPYGDLVIVIELEAKLDDVKKMPAKVVDIPSSRVTSDLACLLESGDDANVTLLCGTESIKAHSAILCARSPVFRAQLKSEFACRLDAVPVPDEIDAPTLRRTLSFIYTDECEPASAEEAQHLLNAADYYKLPRLQAICERKLIDSLSIENVGYSLTLAEQHCALKLKDAALRFVAVNALAVLKTEGWAHVERAAPHLWHDLVITLTTGTPPQSPKTKENAAASAAAAADGERRVLQRTS